MVNATAPPRPTGPPAEPSPPPLALVADVGGKPRVVALSRAAERRGASCGMALAEARALVADLVALPWNGEELARAALEVATVLLAASPRVAWAGGEAGRPYARTLVRSTGWGGEAGVWWVDAAGLGSEAKLARRLACLAGELGFGRARVGVADSAVAAYAATFGRTDARTSELADQRTTGRKERGDAGRRPAPCVPSGGRSPPSPRHGAPTSGAAPGRPTIVPPGGDAAFLAPFPLALLEPDEDLADTCHALGLRTVGQLAALEAEEVESRFGPEGLALHRLARGLDTRGPSAPRDEALPLITCDLGSPVATAEPLLFVLKSAFGSLGAALRSKGLAAREIALTLTLDDGSLAEKAVRPSRPTSHEGALFDHCRAAFEGWVLPEPVSALAVRAAVTVAASGEQGDLLAPRWADPSAIEAAFDRIRGSEGTDAVATPVERDGHLPHDAGAWKTDARTRGRADTRTGGPAGERTEGARSGVGGGDARLCERSEQPEGVAPAGPATRRLLHIARSDRTPLRPPERPTAAALRLLTAPRPIRVRLGRAGLEAFRHGETWHDVTAWSGPERLAPRWWVPSGSEGDATAARNSPAAGAVGHTRVESTPARGDERPAPLVAGPRDYYSARTADGALWLLFRAGAPGRWFVEGWWD